MEVKYNLSIAVIVFLVVLLTYACRKKSMLNAEDYFDGPARELAVAIQRNHLDKARTLVGQVDLNGAYRQSMTFLFWAIANANKPGLAFLLEAGADPNKPDPDGATPVAFVARGSDQDYLKILLAHKGDPNSRNGQSPATMEAIFGDRWANVVYLLDQGADINAVDQRGQNLIMTCAGLNSFDEVAYLMDRGADVSHKNSYADNLAWRVQDANPNFGTENYKWQQIVRKKLIDKGITFPVPNPWEERQKQHDKNE